VGTNCLGKFPDRVQHREQSGAFDDYRVGQSNTCHCVYLAAHYTDLSRIYQSILDKIETISRQMSQLHGLLIFSDLEIQGLLAGFKFQLYTRKRNIFHRSS
jgi:hypothetical protein